MRGLTPLIHRFGQMKKFYSKGFGGDALYKEIIADAEEETTKLGCFVAGTLVHTKDGLRPIEEIKVGDYVLSKPESGKGEVSYKRVTKTFEYEGREVWFVGYRTLGPDSKFENVVVTPSHPFWVKSLSIYRDETEPLSEWVKVSDLLETYAEGGEWPILELQDGRLAELKTIGPILRLSNPDQGLIYRQDKFEGEGKGLLVSFSEGYPRLCLNEDNRYINVEMDLDRDEDYKYVDVAGYGSIVSRTEGFHPLTRKVYNLEVEENHTYYVGDAGVWVHNTSPRRLG